jgi:Peptidase A4 family
MRALARSVRRAALVAATLGALAASAGFAGAASASPAQALNGDAQFDAGYGLTPSNGVASVSTTFKVPTITCLTGGGPGQSFGVWGFDTQTAYVAEAAVQTYCVGSTPIYNFYILANSTNVTEGGVFPGDTVVASFYETPGWTEATVHDLTQNVTWAQAWEPDSSYLPASTIWIGTDSIPGNGYVAPFGSVKFTQTQVNGDYLGYENPSGYNWTRFLTNNTVRVLVSASTITAGDNFTLTFHHSH